MSQPGPHLPGGKGQMLESYESVSFLEMNLKFFDSGPLNLEYTNLRAIFSGISIQDLVLGLFLQ